MFEFEKKQNSSKSIWFSVALAAVAVSLIYCVYRFWRKNSTNNNTTIVNARPNSSSSQSRSTYQENDLVADDQAEAPTFLPYQGNARTAQPVLEKHSTDECPPGDYYIKYKDRFIEPSAGLDKIEDGVLISRKLPRGEWTYTNHKLVFEFDNSPFGACLSSTAEGQSIRTLGLNTTLQSCKSGKKTYMDRQGRIFFEKRGFIMIDLKGFHINNSRYTEFDIIKKT